MTWVLLGTGVDSSLNVHSLFLADTVTHMLTKPNGSLTATYTTITLTQGTLSTNSNAFFDGTDFYLISEGTQYQGTPAVATGGSMILTSTNNDCDCTNPVKTTTTVTLTDSGVISVGFLGMGTGGTTPAVNVYALTLTEPADITMYQNAALGVTCAAGSLDFTLACLSDISVDYGTADQNIDLSACVTYNGAALTAPQLATSVITVTDITNGNADALGYAYMNLNAQTLEVAVSTEVAPVT